MGGSGHAAGSGRLLMGAVVALLALRRGWHHRAVVTVAKTSSGEPAPATWEAEPGGIDPGRTVVLDEPSESTWRLRESPRGCS